MTQPSILSRVTHNIREYRRLRNSEVTHGTSQFQLPAFIINLERSPERRQYIVAHLSSLGIPPTITNAVDGKALSMATLVQDGTYDDALCQRTFDRSLSLGEIACSMSHLAIYRRMVEQDIPVALVSEDDAKFPADALAQLEALLAAAPADWELLQLRYDARRHESLTPPFVHFPYENGLPVGSTAYLIRRSAAQKILAGALPVRYPADSMLGRAAQWGVKVYGIEPIMVDVNNLFPSAIQGNRNLRFRLSNAAKQILLKIIG